MIAALATGVRAALGGSRQGRPRRAERVRATDTFDSTLRISGSTGALSGGRWLAATGAMAAMSLTLIGAGSALSIGPYAASAPQIAAAQSAFQVVAFNLDEDIALTSNGGAEPAASGAAPRGSLSLTQSLLAFATSPAEPQPIEKTVSLGSGDTLMQVLTEAGANRTDAYHAIEALKPIYNPRRVKAGQEIALTFEQADPLPAGSTDDGASEDTDEATPPLRLAALSMQPDIDRAVAVRLTESGNYTGEEIFKELREGHVRASGRINSSLFLAAAEAGIPPAITIELIRMYSYSVDFQREIQPGDSFEVFFTRKYDEYGTPVKDGDVLYANLSVNGKTQRLWRFDPADGPWDYFDENGRSAKKFLMKTPIDGARLSSGFGKRRHPILGYNKMHTGVDFAAPRGTPIYAAGDGTVEMAQRHGGYGKYVRIRHANGYKTAYAHMNGYARGVKRGARVRQGQVIGYVGSTGRSTGPHLHYEVHVNGRKVNPRTIRVPTGRKLAGEHLNAFNAARVDIDTMMAAAPAMTRLAEARIGDAN